MMNNKVVEFPEENIGSFNHGTEDSKVPCKPEKSGLKKTNFNFPKWFAFLFIGLMVFSCYRVQTKDRTTHVSADTVQIEDRSKFNEINVDTEEDTNARTPKILWVLIPMQLEGLKMTEAIVAKHVIHMGKKSGFEVRVVNSFTAYDWLSPEMTEAVRKTKHTSKYILSVHQLLRIALLIEHGGLSLQISRYFFAQNFNWIIEILDQKLQDLIKNQQAQHTKYCNSDKEPQVMLFYEKRRDAKIYEDWFIYARKNSSLLTETFMQMCKILTEGTQHLEYFSTIQQIDQEVLVKYFNNLFIQIINYRQRYWYTGDSFCRTYHVLSIDKHSGPFFTKIEAQKKAIQGFQIQREQFYTTFGGKYIVETDPNYLSSQFFRVLNQEDLGADKNSILRQDIIEIEGNQWMLNPVKKERSVNFCIISLKPLNLQDYEASINESLRHLSEQTFQKWKALYFVTGLQQTNKTLSYAPVTIINYSQFEGLNLQRAATKYCYANDLGLILNYDETLGDKADLAIIAENMGNRNVYGAILSVKQNQTTIKPKYIHNRVKRKMHNSNVSLFQQIAHSFRVFSMYSYKSIPHMALHDNYGRYYDRQVPFLTLLEMGWDYNRCDNSDMVYHTKKIEQKIQIPKYRIVLQDIVINMPFLKEIDVKKHQYFTKFPALTLCEAMYIYLQRKNISLQHFFVLNDGSQFIGFQDRKSMPRIIENKIHQIWVGGEIPKFKKFLTDKNRENHPNFQYYLWTDNNITRENFPVSYDLIKLLIEFSKTSKYNKLAGVCDLMRTEIIYNHGGIYIDTNYLVFNKNALDDWLSFKGMFITQIFPFHRFQRQQSVFAAKKGFDRIERLVNHRTISSRNHYSKFINIQSGPTFFTQTVLGEQQLDVDILQPSFEYLFPYYPRYDQNYGNLCEAKGGIQPQDILFSNKRTYRKDCGELYPWAIGMDFWAQGRSWK